MIPRVEGRDIQHDDDNVGDDGHYDQSKFEPPIIELKPQPGDMRRSTKEPQPSKRYYKVCVIE